MKESLVICFIQLVECIDPYSVYHINRQYQKYKHPRFSYAGYRDDSLETVKKNRDDYEMPLKIMSYEELYGWSMDNIVKQV